TSSVGRVIVKTGEVSVDARGSAVAVGAGMQTLLRAGQPPSSPAAIDPSKTAAPATRPNEKKPAAVPAASPNKKTPDAKTPAPAPSGTAPPKPAETLDTFVAKAQDATGDEAQRIAAIDRIPHVAKEEERNAARSAVRELLRRDASEKVRAAAV